VELHVRVQGRQSFVHDGERRKLRSQDPAATNHHRKQAYDFTEIHSGSFDFTLATA
jgi:hypothetical protein